MMTRETIRELRKQAHHIADDLLKWKTPEERAYLLTVLTENLCPKCGHCHPGELCEPERNTA